MHVNYAAVTPSTYDRWLAPEVHEPGVLEDILQPCPADAMDGRPVSRRVNDPKVVEPV